MSAPFRLDGKRALVTGGASGIGASVVALLREQGAKTLVLDLNPPESEGIRCDVADPQSVAAAFTAADEQLGGAPDILVCCAGIGGIADLLETTPEQFDRFLAVNVKGVYLCCQESVRRMQAAGNGGAIVAIASLISKLSLERRFGYGVSKTAVLGIVRSIAQDYVGDKIRCNAVCPARVHTPLVDSYLAKTFPGHEQEEFARLEAAQPVGRMGTTAEIAHLVLYLCSDEAAFVTGAAYDIDGGCVAMR